MKYTTLIFLDIDGTLLGPDYKPNSSLLPVYIRKLSKKGYLFCLNSNRSRQDLIPLVRQFSITGPVVAENGAFYMESGKIFVFVHLPVLRTKLLGLLQDISKKYGALVECGDTVDYSWKKLKDIPLAWIMNGNRKYTGSIHVRKYGKRDLMAAKTLARNLKQFLPSGYRVETSPIFCNVLISSTLTDKGKAIEILRMRFPGARIIMIGDDQADLATQTTVDEFYAVKNAEEKLKRKACYVAREKYTKGVIEILQHIENININHR